jgi:hypothetical protein
MDIYLGKWTAFETMKVDANIQEDNIEWRDHNQN